MTPEQSSRFWAKVRKTDTCWLWIGATQSRGYGSFGIDGRSRSVHRLVWEITAGPIPDGLTINHLCGVKACVNPAHLEVATYAQNNQHAHDTGLAPPSRLSVSNAAKLTCPAGHFYTPENTYTNPRGHRQCRTCKRDSWRKSKANAAA